MAKALFTRFFVKWKKIRIIAIFLTAFIFAAHFYFWNNNNVDFTSATVATLSNKSYLTKGSGDNLTVLNFKDVNWVKFGLEQSDPLLLEIVKKSLLISPPPVSEQDTRFDEKLLGDPNGCNRKFTLIEKLLGPSPGFFIESGAYDGIFLSSTLRLEKTRNWTGLLIEPHPYSFQTLLKKNRNAWKINAALCVTPVTSENTFWIHPDVYSGWASISSLSHDAIIASNKQENYVNITVPCVPLYTILKAMDVSTVDFLNLDVESAELGVLSTLPFDKIRFKVMAIEHDHVPGGPNALKRFLEPKGYRFVEEINTSMTKDLVFVHESVQLPGTAAR